MPAMLNVNATGRRNWPTIGARQCRSSGHAHFGRRREWSRWELLSEEVAAMAFLSRNCLGACLLVAATMQAALLTTARAADGVGEPRIIDVRVGFDATFKVGHWTPIWIDVQGSDTLVDPSIEITVDDNDGVPSTVSVPVPKPDTPESLITVQAAARSGRMGSPFDVALVSDGKVVHRWRAHTGEVNGVRRHELPATGELLVAFGEEPFGWEEAFAGDEGGSQVTRRAVQLQSSSEMPGNWFAYEAIDVLVFSVGDGRLIGQLAADTQRLSAVRQWVELGGRLVVLCDGKAAPDLLAEGRPLAPLVPGRFVETVRLSQTGPLEHFSERSALISGEGARVELAIPRLRDVTGSIEAFAGQQPGDLPLVARGALGLGEVAFAGVDLSAPPLAQWPGRAAFLRALLRPYLASHEAGDSPQSLMTLGYNDLSGALRQRLGSTFRNVTTVKFPVVAALAVFYLALLGPADYWLVHRVLRRPGLAWVSFAALVTVTSVGAYALGAWSKGTGEPRLNQVELVDVDLTSGRARGTYWAAIYSPDSRRYDLGLDVPQLGDAPRAVGQLLLASWGLPGSGIGGMDAQRIELGLTRTGYRFSAMLDALEDVPILTASTKSLLGRWTASAPSQIEADLSQEDGLALGSLVNRSGGVLKNARLMYGSWAYRLGDLADGEEVQLGQHLNAIQVKTMVARTAGISADRLAGETGRTMFLADRASVHELLNLMMFYEAGGGQGFAELPNRYQGYCDLSRLIQLGRAILVAESPARGSVLIDRATGSALAHDDDAAAVMVRFVLPVKNSP
jgi:hypothetical protein